MFSRIRKRATYANVAMTLALVFAMSGGAYAAKHYLITSIKQINPKVVAQLKGKAGPAGPAGSIGPAGPIGPAGAAGKNGANGVNGTPGAPGAPGVAGEPWTPNNTLPSEATETGSWAASIGNGGAPEWLSVSFPVQLASELGATQVHVAPNAACPGSASKPEAEPGNLCVYIGFSSTEEIKLNNLIFKPSGAPGLPDAGAGVAGAVLLVSNTAAANAETYGTWAITAE